MDNIFATPTYIVVNLPSPVAETSGNGGGLIRTRRYVGGDYAGVPVASARSWTDSAGNRFRGSGPHCRAMQPFEAEFSELSRSGYRHLLLHCPSGGTFCRAEDAGGSAIVSTLALSL
jgi:hypothetical protein